MIRTTFLVIFLGLVLVQGKPSRNKTPQTLYDQKQTGDYNVQLHLKDFQIIALLGDDTLGGLGDYDYSYDYADYTVKPPNATSTTASPATPSSTVFITTNSTDKVTSSPTSPSENTQTSTTTQKSILLLGEQPSSKPDEASPTPGPSPGPTPGPGLIKVEIVESPKKNAVSIVDDLEESLNKRCLTGFARDKKGRCRRIRRQPSSNFPLGLGRLASLASRFRATEDTTKTR